MELKCKRVAVAPVTPIAKKPQCSLEAWVLAVLDAERVPLKEQQRVLHVALTAVINKRREIFEPHGE